ncbi:MAG: amine dehydrogenase large subunit [Steroidobacteraceae bacterium]
MRGKIQPFLQCLAMAVLCGAQSVTAAEILPDPLVGQDLPEASRPHWVWVNDIVFSHLADGKAFLIDGDSGQMLGMLSTGFAFNTLLLPRDASVILSPEIYFSRGVRGERTDVVTLYDPLRLSPVGEIPIPPGRAIVVPMHAVSTLTDDDRFLLLYAFSPAQKVQVVDVKRQAFVGEIEIPGCALVYPTGPRDFFSLCGDGSALAITLDDEGKPIARRRTQRLFDPETDPVTEKAVRVGDRWMFASFAGDLLEVQVGSRHERLERWSLTTDEQRAESWRPGGMQHLAVHQERGWLYSLMHQGGPDTHKDPGSEVWVYDLKTRRQLKRIPLDGPLTSIAVTRDEQPLMFGLFIGATELQVYDATTGEKLRTVGEIGFTPTTLVTY